jgi:hypothetical protein
LLQARRLNSSDRLDAAYDRTRVKKLPQPTYPVPPADAFASAEKYMAYLARVWNRGNRPTHRGSGLRGAFFTNEAQVVQTVRVFLAKTLPSRTQ